MPLCPAEVPLLLLLLGSVLCCLVVTRLPGGRESNARAIQAGAVRAGEYVLGKLIGEGGMGVVYRALHAHSSRVAAVKLLRADDTARRARFEHEAMVLSRVRHPNIVELYEQGHTRDDEPYMVMELLQGTDLQCLVEESGAQKPAHVARLLLQVCDALTVIHEQGFVHRDIKPANLFLSCGDGTDTLKVLDFGLAKNCNASTTAQESCAVVGSPFYMAPEAFTQPEQVGPRADLYALGSVAYTLLTGKTLFDGESVASLAAQHIYVAPPSLSDASPEPISPEFEALIMRCLAKSPAQRPASAAQIREALLACREMSERCAIERRVERSATDKQFESLMFTVPDPMLWRELPAAGLAA